MAPTCIGLVMEIIARGSETTENHYDPTGDAALSLPSAASTNPVINLQSDAGPHHTQPFLLAYTFQYHGPVTEAESVLFTIGDRMPTYPGVISHAAAVYAPESLTQQYINEFFARYFSANWVITQDPGAILSYHADTTEAAVAYMQAEAETDIRSRNATSRTAVVTFIEGLEKITIDSLAESSRECSICRGMRFAIPPTSHPPC